MTAQWTAPRTYTTGEVVTAAMLNTQVRDNFEFLKLREDTPLNALITSALTAYSTTSTTFTDVDTSVLGGSLTLGGAAPVLIAVASSWKSTTLNADACLDVTVDGTRIGGATYGSAFMTTLVANAYLPVAFLHPKSLSAGAHTFRLQWRVSAGSLSMGNLTPTSFVVVELI